MEVQLKIHRELSYRYYKKLPTKEKVILDKANLMPCQKLIAMYINKHITKNMALAIKESSKYYYLTEYKETNPKYLIKELQFRGFIPLHKYKKFKPQYCHMITNQKIGGDFWIYPENFYIDDRDKNKGLRFIYDVWGKYGIQTYTKLRYGD